MCQCWLHEEHRLHIGILMCFLVAKPRRPHNLYSPSQYICGTIFLALHSMVWDWRVSRAGPYFYWYKLLYPFVDSTISPFHFFLYTGWHCGAGVFGVMGRRSLSPGLSLPTSFNNNNNISSITLNQKGMHPINVEYDYTSPDGKAIPKNSMTNAVHTTHTWTTDTSQLTHQPLIHHNTKQEPLIHHNSHINHWYNTTHTWTTDASQLTYRPLKFGKKYPIPKLYKLK